MFQRGISPISEIKVMPVRIISRFKTACSTFNIVCVGKERGDYWNREGTRSEVRWSFPRQVTHEDPAVTAVQVDQVGKRSCVVGGPGIPPHPRAARDYTSEANLKGPLLGPCPIAFGNYDRLIIALRET